MSVQTWNRSDSKMQYLSLTLDLSKEVFTLMSHAHAKYRQGIGDQLSKLCIEAMYNGKLANSIYVLGSKHELFERRYHLLAMAACVGTISSMSSAVIDTMKSVDGISDKQFNRFLHHEERIGKLTKEITKRIFGLIESDMKRWNKRYPMRKVKIKERVRTAMGDLKFNKYYSYTSHRPFKGDLHNMYDELTETSEKVTSDKSVQSDLPQYDFNSVR